MEALITETIRVADFLDYADYTARIDGLIDLFQERYSRENLDNNGLFPMCYRDYYDAKHLIEDARSIPNDIHLHYLMREGLQGPISRLPKASYWDNFADKFDVIEINGVDQLTAGIDDNSYETNTAEKILSVDESTCVAFHCGATPALAEPTLKYISSLPANLKERVVVNGFIKLAKDPIKNISQFIDNALSKGIAIWNIRVGVEHALPLLLDAYQSEKAFKEILPTLENIYEVLAEKGITRISLPETRGVLLPEEVYAFYTTQLQLMMKNGLNPDVVEIHCHHDLGLSDLNTLASVIAIKDFNKITGSNIEPAITFNYSGTGERNGFTDIRCIEKLMPMSDVTNLIAKEKEALGLDDDYREYNANHGAGPHLSEIWALALEEMQKIYGVAMPNGKALDDLINLFNSNTNARGIMRNNLLKVMTEGSYGQAFERMRRMGVDIEPRVVKVPGCGSMNAIVEAILLGQGRIPTLEESKMAMIEIKRSYFMNNNNLAEEAA